MMVDRNVVGVCFVLFCSAVGYQLGATPPQQDVAPQSKPLVSTVVASAYGPALTVDEAYEDNEGEYGLIEPEDTCQPEVVCSSWSGCLAACKVMGGGSECYSDCVVDERSEEVACDEQGLCSCDTGQQFCATFCRADG